MSPPLLSLIPVESNVFFPLIFLSLLFILFLTHHRTPTRKQPPLPPGPTPWPVVGNRFQLSRKTPLHISLANLAQVHGPLMLLKMGSHQLIVGSSSAAAREILNTHDRILSGRYISHVIQTKGSKIHNHQLVLHDECDHRWRRVKSELFSARALESQVGIRERKIWELEMDETRGLDWLGEDEISRRRLRQRKRYDRLTPTQRAGKIQKTMQNRKRKRNAHYTSPNINLGREISDGQTQKPSPNPPLEDNLMELETNG
ncbi:hypothetical protein RHGRI_028667 [Rhododendron griersonianum]|uniref:Cytochrome P450 n=1 Tax=Rhododendron griersonianum TaxID=479676 RepID=A0AAV6IGX8_9ERIC|nr:hypothetical protein RHGRI_028667 [Rhododendron griersonianum]